MFRSVGFALARRANLGHQVQKTAGLAAERLVEGVQAVAVASKPTLRAIGRNVAALAGDAGIALRDKARSVVKNPSKAAASATTSVKKAAKSAKATAATAAKKTAAAAKQTKANLKRKATNATKLFKTKKAATKAKATKAVKGAKKNAKAAAKNASEATA